MHANNLVLLGTRVLEGEATCVVINVGDRCAMADLIRLGSQGGDLNTTLHEEINYVVNIFLVFCVILICLFYITYYGYIQDAYPGVHARALTPVDPRISRCTQCSQAI
jgi:magnesium-transporting ATPase (P-type)